MVHNHWESRSSTPGPRWLKAYGVGGCIKGVKCHSCHCWNQKLGQSHSVGTQRTPVYRLGCGDSGHCMEQSLADWPIRWLALWGSSVYTQEAEKRVPGAVTWAETQAHAFWGSWLTVHVDSWEEQKPRKQYRKKHLELVEKEACSVGAWWQCTAEQGKEKLFLFQRPFSTCYYQSLTPSTGKGKWFKGPRSIFVEQAMKDEFADVR